MKEEVEVEEFDDEEKDEFWGDQEDPVEEELEEPEPEPEEAVEEVEQSSFTTSTPSLEEIVQQVIAGEWGSGQDRRARLEKAGISHVLVQKELVRRINHR